MKNELIKLWEKSIQYYGFLPLLLFLLFAVNSALILIAIPNRVIMLTAEFLIYAFLVLEILFVLYILAVIGRLFYVGKMKKGLCLCITEFLAIVVGLCLIAIAGIYNHDPYAYSHPIPSDVEYSIPIDSMEPFENYYVNKNDSTTWIQLRSNEIGNFHCKCFYPSLPTGEVFIRCYEVSTGEPLSVDRIESNTLTPVDSFDAEAFYEMPCILDKSFVIYEGAPFEYYVARLEVWFRSEDKKVERKLLEKNYKVDGWER